VVVLAPVRIDAPEAFLADVHALVTARGLEAVRWIVIEADSGHLAPLVRDLGDELALSVDARFEEAAQQQDLAAIAGPPPQGNRIKKWSRGDAQDSEKVAVVPACKQALVVHAEFPVLLEAALNRLEQVHRDMPQDGEVLSCVAGSDAAIVFAKPDVEHPVELVFDSPVTPGGGKSGLRRELVARGDVVAMFERRLARDRSLRLDADDSLEHWPLVERRPALSVDA
jgi:hypothetical protein